MKKLVLLISLLIFVNLNISALSGMCGPNAMWKDMGDELQITGYGDMYDYSKSYPAPWNSFRSRISKITLQSITHIGSYCFQSFELYSFTDYSAVVSVGDYAFYGTKITGKTYQMPSKLKYIGNYAFSHTQGISVRINSECLEYIGDKPFDGTNFSISDVKVSKATNHIGKKAFGKYNITISIDTANTIYDSRNDCNAIIKTSENKLIIGSNHTIIPSTVTSIGSCAFEELQISQIIIPQNISYIDTCAFSGCDKLKYITCESEEVPILGPNVFKGVSPSCTIFVPAISLEKYKQADQWKDFNIRPIPDNIENIFEYQTKNDSMLSPYKDKMFDQQIITHLYKNGKGKIICAEPIKTIKDSAFWNCHNLSTIILPDSLTSIGAVSFYHCNSVENLHIPALVSVIGKSAFSRCSMLKKITVSPQNNTFDSREDCNAIIETATNTLVRGCKMTIIPNSITKIGDWAFYGCDSLESVIIPDSVTTICHSAFSRCHDLEFVVIPASVNEIQRSAFSNSVKILSITCYNTIPPALGEEVFYGVEEGTILYVPRISISLYKQAEQWKDFVIEPIQEQFDNELWYISSTEAILPLYKTDGFKEKIVSNTYANGYGVLLFKKPITHIGDSAFFGCKDLLSISLPNTITSIGDAAFKGCDNIQEPIYNEHLFVHLPNTYTGNYIFPGSIKSIISYACYGCPKLNRIVLPLSLVTIEDSAFVGCSRCLSVTCLSKTPASVKDEGCFDANMYEQPLYIPQGSQNSYKEAPIWKLFTKQVTENGTKIWSGEYSHTRIGRGTIDDPYIIETPENLAAINPDEDAYYKQINDFNMNGKDWEPIGSKDHPFVGHYDGGNHRVFNYDFDKIYAYKSECCTGLFGYIENASITNLDINCGTIEIITNMAIENNCYFSPFIGHAINCKIENCFVEGSLKFSFGGDLEYLYIGGIVAYTENTDMIDCKNYCSVLYTFGMRRLAMTFVGGIAGFMSGKANLRDCYNYASIRFMGRSLYIGGIVGGANNLYCKRCANFGDLSCRCEKSTSWESKYFYFAGLCPISSSAHILNCYNNGNINVEIHWPITSNYDVTYCSGLIIEGGNDCVIENCYNVGNITSITDYGANPLSNPKVATAFARNAKIRNCYNIGQLIAKSATGLVLSDTCTIENSYYLDTLTMTNIRGIAISETKMKSEDFPSMLNADAFSFDTYNYNQGYPILLANPIVPNEKNVELTTIACDKYKFAGKILYESGIYADTVRLAHYIDSITTLHLTIGKSYQLTDRDTIFKHTTYTYHDGKSIKYEEEGDYTHVSLLEAQYGCDSTITTYLHVRRQPFTTIVTSAQPTWGIVSGGGTFLEDTTITISATPNYGYHFVKWEDGSVEAIRKVVVLSNKTYTATFARNEYSANINVNKSALGTVSNKGGKYLYLDTIQTTATPAFECHFLNWSDGSKSANRKIVVRSDTTVTANFAKNQYLVKTKSNDNEMGITQGDGTYDYGTEVSITAIANEHYHFVTWSDGVTSATRQVLLQKDTTLVATFAPDNYTLTTIAKNGIVSGGGTYAYKQQFTITATPNAHFHFVKWSDGVTTNPRTMTLSQDLSLEAIFAIDQHKLNISAANGTVKGVGTYDYGSTISIEVVPNAHYHFVSWKDDLTATAKRNILLTSDTTFIAFTEIDKHSITANAENGSVTGAGIYDYGRTITLTVIPNDHYHFVKWTDGNKQNPRKVTVATDKTYTAINEIDQHRVVANAQHGYVDGSGIYDYGSFVTLTAQPDNGYQFVKWSNGNEFDPYVFVIEDDVTIEAIFELVTDALDEVTASTHPRKVMINGVIYMQVNNNLYNALGNKIK